MISVNEALKIVKENAFTPSISEVPVLESLGLILAENIIADRDFPPFNRVAMDGVAIAHSTFRGGNSSNFDSNSDCARSHACEGFVIQIFKGTQVVGISS